MGDFSVLFQTWLYRVYNRLELTETNFLLNNRDMSVHVCGCVYVTLFYVEHFTRYTLNRPRTHVVTLNPSLGGTFTSLAGPKKRVFLCKFSTHL